MAQGLGFRLGKHFYGAVDINVTGSAVLVTARRRRWLEAESSFNIASLIVASTKRKKHCHCH